MKRILKTSVSVLLTATMIFGTAAFTGGFDFGELAIKAEAATEYKSGYYTYSVDDNGNATIEDVDSSISGEVKVPTTLGGYPVTAIDTFAFSGCYQITKLVIGDNIEDIENLGIFDSSSKLTSLTLGSKVSKLDVRKIMICNNLTSITVSSNNSNFSSDSSGVLYNKIKTELLAYPKAKTQTSFSIPSTVKIIGDYAFFNNLSLTSITIPNNVTSIGEKAFYFSQMLSSVKIPASVTSIAGAAFSICSRLESITVDAKNKYYSVDSYGVLFNKDKTELLQMPLGKRYTSYTIPGTVKVIGEYAFSNSHYIKNITIPQNVTTIETYAFHACSGLQSVTTKNSIDYIGECAFASCRKLSSVVLPDRGIEIGVDAFKDTAIYNTTSNWSNGVLYIGKHLIKADWFTEPQKYTVKSGTKSIANSAFSQNQKLTGIVLPNGLEHIGSYAFYGTSIDKVVIPEGVKIIGSGAFRGAAIESVELPDSVTDIGEYAFRDTLIKSVVIPNGVTVIRTGTFYGCYELKSAVVSDSVTKIESSAFMNTAIESIEIPDGVTEIGSGAFSHTAIERVEIPRGVTVIKVGTFDCCYELKTVVMTDSITEIEERVFNGYTVNDIYYTGSEEDWNNIIIGNWNYGLEGATIHYSYVLPEKPTTTKPATTKPATTKPATTKPATTKPITTQPATTKPVSTTKPSVVPTTKPSTTKPVTKPESTTKPYVEENNIKKPSNSTVKYGETLILHINTTNIPENVKIEWSVVGSGVTISPSADGKTCAVTSTATGDVTVTAKYVDANGVEHVSEQEIKSNASFWQKIVSFFKNLFGLDRIIEQRIKFNR